MKTLLFIHGTGVRKASYSASFALVQQALNAALGPMNVRAEPCYWGGSCGSTLFLRGASIPDFDVTKAIAAEDPEDSEYLRGLWSTLYENPAAELQVLALRSPGKAPPPGRVPPGEELRYEFNRLWPEFPMLDRTNAGRLREMLRAAGLLAHFEAAHQGIALRPSSQEALRSAQAPLTQYRLALARALVAGSTRLSWDRGDLEEGEVLLDGFRRDEIVELLVAALGGRDAGLWAMTGARRLFARAGTRWFRRRRARLSEQAAPFGADVVAYQARPRPIRDFIRNAIEVAARAAAARDEPGELYLLAHSLGGIAAFEALVESPLPAVTGLITVGSQGPLLYELDALGALPLPKDASGRPTGAAGQLPDHFVRAWLNVYDPNDFLSYRAEPVFGPECVRDVRLDNRQPFPESHSAYWANAELWKAVASFVGGRS